MSTLGRIVEMLGPQAVAVAHAPAGLELELSGPRIYDPHDTAAIAPGELVLGVGVSGADVPALLAAAASAGAHGVAIRGSLPSDATVDDIAVLAISDALTWDQLLRIAQTATSSSPASDPDDRPLRDLFSLADAIAALVGGAVTIEDPRSTLLAYSSLDQPIDEARRQTILGRSHGNYWGELIDQQGIFGQVFGSPGTVVKVHDEDGRARDRLVVAVGSQVEVLGLIWVVEGDQPFDSRSEELLRDACPLAALHLLRHRSSGDLSRRQRGAVLRDLLDGLVTAEVAAEDLGLDPADSCAVAVFELALDDPVELSTQRARAVDAITVAVEAFRRRVVCAWIDQRVYALLPSLTASGEQRLVSLVRSIADNAAQSLGIAVLAGVGSTVSTLKDFASSRAEADRVVEVLHGDPSIGASAHINDVRIPAAIVAIRELLRDHTELHLPALDELAVQDAKHGTEYVATLRALTIAGGSISEVGKMLSLHPNSVRYRIARIEELTGLSLSDPATLYVIATEFYRQDP